LIQLRCSKQHFIATYNCVEAECGVLECPGLTKTEALTSCPNLVDEYELQ
jgi:hypothetical protein